MGDAWHPAADVAAADSVDGSISLLWLAGERPSSIAARTDPAARFPPLIELCGTVVH